ncbi:MAG TPA: GNAT family N-acetyltransferase [Myxococcales bacterium]|nr:GNAT family N-acetyltransferase [Myxococcales bacterium]
MIAELVGPDDPRWRQALEAAAHDVYHLPGYGPLYEREPEVQELALHVRGEGAELLLPLLVRPVPELPGWSDATSPYGYPGPVVRGTFSPEELEGLQRRVADLFRERRILACFVRGSPLLPGGDALLERLGTVVRHGDTAVIELDRPDEEILEGYSNLNHRIIGRALKRGYTVRVDDWSHLPGFVALYQENMRRVGAAPFYFFDADYFARLKALLGDRAHLVSVLSPTGELAGGQLVTACHGLVNAHLNATSGAHLDVSPCRLLNDATWRWARANGARIVNFGGGYGGRSDSLLAFKMSFATGTRPFRTARLVCDQRRYEVACAASGASGGDLTGFFPAYRGKAFTRREAESAAAPTSVRQAERQSEEKTRGGPARAVLVPAPPRGPHA